MTSAAKIYNEQITEPVFCKVAAQEIMSFPITTIKINMNICHYNENSDGDDDCIVDLGVLLDHDHQPFD